MTNVGATFALFALGLQAGVIVALALALFAALARARVSKDEWETRVAADNEALRDEVWRLKEAASGRDRAEAASEAKSRFLATMSHEIRTPISGVIGMADLLRQSSLSPENASYVEAIRSSATALIALIDEILDLSKIEAGHFDLTVESVDLVNLVEGVVELLSPRTQSKGLEIATSIRAETPRFVRADPGRLRQVLTNLAGNAIKFTDSGGVCVFVEPGEGDNIHFAVVDTGPGVPLERRSAIFEDFEQGDGSNARRHEGAGLGLAISRRLVALMGGALTLADNAGGGSVFSFSIPLPRCKAPPSAGLPDARPVALKGARALIIANSPFEAPAIAARLLEVGAKVERAEGLESGLAALQRPHRPDLVIVDCALGSEATNQLAQAARAAGALKSLVLFSPFERRTFGQASLQGFDGWLVKPVRARSLLERVAAEFPAMGIAALSEQTAKTRLCRRRALLAEDNDINALIAEKALARLGFEVVHARDGDEAVRLTTQPGDAAAPLFDLILMDLKMPGLDGLEATRRLRAHEAATATRPTPIIALTAQALEAEKRICLTAGFDAFLTKPFEFRELGELVARLCEPREVEGGDALDRAS